MEKAYRTMKVFDCQDQMDDDVKKALFRIYDHTGNDCFIDYTIADSVWEEDEGHDYKLLDKWLIENGAEGPREDGEVGETVLIKFWW